MYFMVINVRFRWAYYDWVKKIVRRMMQLEKYSLHRQQNRKSFVFQNFSLSPPPKIMVRPLKAEHGSLRVRT